MNDRRPRRGAPREEDRVMRFRERGEAFLGLAPGAGVKAKRDPGPTPAAGVVKPREPGNAVLW
jgi:hypothetical protein